MESLMEFVNLSFRWFFQARLSSRAQIKTTHNQFRSATLLRISFRRKCKPTPNFTRHRNRHKKTNKRKTHVNEMKLRKMPNVVNDQWESYQIIFDSSKSARRLIDWMASVICTREEEKKQTFCTCKLISTTGFSLCSF